MAVKKELQVRTKGQCCEIYFEGGGKLPDALAGLYTSKTEAQKAISVFQANVQAKVKKG